MRRKRASAFKFMGFVALADTLFAVSAGLLLLNPIEFGSQAGDASEPTSESELALARSIEEEIRRIEESIAALDESGALLEAQASEMAGNEIER